MMFAGKDWQALQILIETSTITPENQKTPQQGLDAINTAIKSEEHFQHFWDEHLLDVWQQPDEGIHAWALGMAPW